MNENPVTRIVPQKRSETLMLQRLAGICEFKFDTFFSFCSVLKVSIVYGRLKTDHKYDVLNPFESFLLS